MKISDGSFLRALKEAVANGEDVAALDLHLEALVYATAGDVEDASASLAAAQVLESAAGFSDGALHTAHQMALLSNFGGDVSRLDHYYRETVVTLSKMRNRKGVALCLRTIGEIALVRPGSSEVQRAWDLSEKLFTKIRAPEARQLATWRARVSEMGLM